MLQIIIKINWKKIIETSQMIMKMNKMKNKVAGIKII